MGAIAGGANDAQFEAACQFAACFGLAFQIRDDMLDVIGTADELGKNVGTDSVKNTFVKLYGLDRCAELVDLYSQKAMEALDAFDDASFLRQLVIKMMGRMK